MLHPFKCCFNHHWIAIWNDQQHWVIQGTPFSENCHLRDETPYKQWYINHIIRYISLNTESFYDEVNFTTMLYISLPCVLIHDNDLAIYFTV